MICSAQQAFSEPTACSTQKVSTQKVRAMSTSGTTQSVHSGTSKYTAVVLYYKLGPDLYKTVASLVGQTLPPARIVVVDNNSGDGIVREVCRRYPQCEPLVLSENEGYSGGMSAGLRRVSKYGQRILFMTHEVILARNCVEEMTRAFEMNSQLVLASPVLTHGVGGPVWSLGGKFGKFGTVQHITSVDDLDTLEWLDGACLFAEMNAFTTIGGFDHDYFLYWEDVDISVRLHEVGEISCVATAMASQGTSMAPTYFKLRNQVMFWRKQQNTVNVVKTIAAAVAKILLRDLRHMNIQAVRVRLLALCHGFTGNMSVKYNHVRVS